MSNAYYTDSRYAFTAATPERKYIKYLAQIAKFNSEGIEPTRKQVQIALGDPIRVRAEQMEPQVQR